MLIMSIKQSYACCRFRLYQLHRSVPFSSLLTAGGTLSLRRSENKNSQKQRQNCSYCSLTLSLWGFVLSGDTVLSGLVLSEPGCVRHVGCRAVSLSADLAGHSGGGWCLWEQSLMEESMFNAALHHQRRRTTVLTTVAPDLGAVGPLSPSVLFYLSDSAPVCLSVCL